MDKIVLGGMKHCGKSTVGKLLAQKLGLPFADLDDLILKEARDFTSIREVYKTLGKSGFQDLELLSFVKFLEEKRGSWVLALGGGVIDNSHLCDLMEPNKILKVFLKGEEAILFSRIVRGGIPPFLEGEDPRLNFHHLFTRRTDLYDLWASLIIETETKNSLSLTNILEKRIRNHT